MKSVSSKRRWSWRRSIGLVGALGAVSCASLLGIDDPEEKVRCGAGAECSIDQLCVAGECRNGCRIDDDCSAGERCVRGACALGSGGTTGVGGEAGDGSGAATSGGGDGGVSTGGGATTDGGVGGITSVGGDGGGGLGGADGGTTSVGGTPVSHESGGTTGSESGAAGMSAGGSGGSTECQSTDADCEGFQPRVCMNGVWTNSGPKCEGFCKDGACVEAPSCRGLATCVDSESCCATIWIPDSAYDMGQGDTEVPDKTYSRTVSGFYLDRFEVTVGRFGAFLSNYSAESSLPHLTTGDGSGAHPKVPGSGWDPSWQNVIDADHAPDYAVPRTKADLLKQLVDDCPEGGTWSLAQPNMPVNCVNWYVAYAFCAWDKGRLPTEAEWNLAAAHGDEERVYPWSNPPSSPLISAQHACYYSSDDVIGPCLTGSKSAGRGGFSQTPTFGHDDLSGNVAEWVADAYVTEPPTACVNCLELWQPSNEERSVRGGSWANNYPALRSGNRSAATASYIDSIHGLRCARDK